MRPTESLRDPSSGGLTPLTQFLPSYCGDVCKDVSDEAPDNLRSLIISALSEAFGLTLISSWCLIRSVLWYDLRVGSNSTIVKP